LISPRPTILRCQSRKRHEDLIVLIGSGRRSPLRAKQADDAQLHIVDANRLAHGIRFIGEELLVDGFAKKADRRHFLRVVFADNRP